jgi:predicted CXXCH cytochrome family protein
MKNLIFIFSVTSFCLAVTVWSGEAEYAASGDVSVGNSTSNQPVIWYEASTDSLDPVVLKMYEYSKSFDMDVVRDPATDLQPLDWNGIPIFTQTVRQATTHPIYSGIDHLHTSHQLVSSSVDGVLDACSLACLSCHDGINASETRVKTVGEWELPFDSGQFSHPLGVDYDKAFSRNSDLQPSAFLPSDIILPEGKVGCESCHNLYSKMPYFLVFSNMDSTLCTGCHNK